MICGQRKQRTNEIELYPNSRSSSHPDSGISVNKEICLKVDLKFASFNMAGREAHWNVERRQTSRFNPKIRREIDRKTEDEERECRTGRAAKGHKKLDTVRSGNVANGADNDVEQVIGHREYCWSRTLWKVLGRWRVVALASFDVEGFAGGGDADGVVGGIAIVSARDVGEGVFVPGLFGDA